MAKTLGQEEIDAMFATARAEVDQAPAAADEVEGYNFGRGGQISNDQMRAIATVNDLFARNLMQSVGAWLRTEYKVAMVSAEQMGFVEFVERLAETTYVCSVRLEPLGAIGILEIEPALAAPMVEILLGGRGRPEPPRAMTDIEDLIMVSVVQVIIKELNTAWAAVGLHFSFERRESQSQVSRLMPSGEKTLCVCFEAQMPEIQGVFNLCLPAMVLNTILRKLISVRERSRRGAESVRGRVRELLSESTVGTVLQFVPFRVSATRIATLEVGAVLRLPVPSHEAAELKVLGLSVGAAWPVRVGEQRAARLENTTSRRSQAMAGAAQ